MPMPQTEAAMRRHMMAEPPAGHGADVADMPMADMASRHASMHDGDAGHDHQMAKGLDLLRFVKIAREPISFVKGSDTTVEGWGMPFYGPFNGDDGIGRDFDGEFFSAKTDFVLDWFAERPLLYQHTWDAKVGTDRLGGVPTHEKRKDGIWVQAQLDLRSKWYEAIRDLIGQQALSFSSGANPAAVVIAKSGEILRWPWVELTLTPTPANPFASIAAAKAFDITPGDMPPVAVLVPDLTITPNLRRLRHLRIVGVHKPS